MRTYKPWHDNIDAANVELSRRISILESSNGYLDLSDLLPIDHLPTEQLYGKLVVAINLTPSHLRITAPNGKAIDLNAKRHFDFSGIESLERLEVISMRHIAGKSFGNIRALSSLKAIEASFCDFDPTEGISSSKGITSFTARFCKLSSLSQLRSMEQLAKIVATNCPLKTLGELGELPSLIYLDISKTNVSDISHILNFPLFANEKAEFLNYSDTPAARLNNRFNMVGNIAPNQSAIQTVQYIKGTHPDFKAPEGGALGADLEDRLRDLSPARVVIQGGRICAENQGPTEYRDDEQKSQRLKHLTWLCSGFLEDAAQTQCPQQLMRRISRLLDHTRDDNPIFYIIDSSIRVLRASLDDPYISSGLDAGLLETLKEITLTGDGLRPLMNPPLRRSELAINSLPDITSDPSMETISRLASDLSNELAKESLDDDISKNVRLVAEDLSNEASSATKKPLSALSIKSITGKLAGFVSFLSSAASVHAWIASPAGTALLVYLKTVLDALLALFR